ncbi:tyrosine-type recombinase/integrase [Maricaulis sp.]|uniref:tyrosine-type recombinase/integrase n=1 Tax=Maricaulis sp. TaxID=1486257 RepID=UPI003A9233ED
MSEAMASIELKHLVRDRDRHGNPRVYVRVPGQRKVRIRDAEGSPEFFEAYKAAIAGTATPGASPRGRRPRRKPGSIGALIVHYERSGDFRALANSTRAVRKRILDRLDIKIGAFPVRDLTALHIKTWRDAPEGPEAGNTLVKTLRKVFELAIEDGLTTANPAAGVKYRRGNPEGWAPWTAADVARFAARHPRGTMAHKALALFLFTGARLSDVRRMGPQHEREAGRWLNFTQHKGRTRKPIIVDVPIIAPLREAIDACPAGGQLAYMVSSYGTPFKSDKSFGNWFAKRVAEAGIEGKSAHGIRKGLGDILAEIGCSAHQIMAILGHTTLKQAEVYTRHANRKRMAGDGMAQLAAALEADDMMALPAVKAKGEK